MLAPLGIDDFFLGVPAEELDRCADLIAPPPPSTDYSALPPDHFLLRTLLNPPLSTKVCNGSPWRQGAVGAAGGHGNARGIALAQALVSHGGELAGTRLLSPALVERVLEVQAEGTDLVLAVPMRFGIGWGLPTPAAPAVPEGRVCWWTGYGGAIVVNDLDRRVDRRLHPRPDGRPHDRLAAHRRLRPHRLRLPGGRMSSSPSTPHVCVIGAGCSGITVAKRLAEFGISYDQFEMSDDVGGNWYFRNPNGRSAVYESLHIDTSTTAAAVRGLPRAGGLPRLPAPHPDPRLLPGLRRPLRAARGDRVRRGGHPRRTSR